MSGWFRFYGDALNDRKVQSLPPELFKAWVNLLCLACNEQGKPFDVSLAAFALRLTDSKAQSVIDDLLNRGLLDDTAAGLVPHNWNSRQYKSDTSNQRVSAYRKKKRNVTPPLHVTAPDTDQISEPNGSDANASAREALWGNGVTSVIALGVAEARAKPMIGRWLKDAGDDHAKVLDVIDRARREAPIDPIAWITAALKGKANGKVENLSAVARRFAEGGISFGPKPSLAGNRGAENSPPVRMLPEW